MVYTLLLRKGNQTEIWLFTNTNAIRIHTKQLLTRIEGNSRSGAPKIAGVKQNSNYISQDIFLKVSLLRTLLALKCSDRVNILVGSFSIGLRIQARHLCGDNLYSRSGFTVWNMMCSYLACENRWISRLLLCRAEKYRLRKRAEKRLSWRHKVWPLKIQEVTRVEPTLKHVKTWRLRGL